MKTVTNLETVNSSIINNLADIGIYIYDYQSNKDIIEYVMKKLCEIRRDCERVLDVCNKMQIRKGKKLYNFGLSFEGAIADLKALEYLTNELFDVINYIENVKDIISEYDIFDLQEMFTSRIDQILEPLLVV